MVFLRADPLSSSSTRTKTLSAPGDIPFELQGDCPCNCPLIYHAPPPLCQGVGRGCSKNPLLTITPNTPPQKIPPSHAKTAVMGQHIVDSRQARTQPV
jgi:hypothetical protein